MNVLLENTLPVKFMWNHAWDSGGLFSISSQVKMLITSLLSCLTLRLYLDVVVYDLNIFGSSSKAFDNLLLFQNVCEACGESFENLRKSSEIGWKSLENCHNVIISMYIFLKCKQHKTWLLVDMEYLLWISLVFNLIYISIIQWTQFCFADSFYW